MEELSISRGNGNMNIRALIDWGIVFKVYKRGERKEYFESEKDIYALAQQVAIERKKRELDPINKLLKKLEHVKDKGESYDEFMKVTDELKHYTNDATDLLDMYIRNNKKWFFSLAKKMM